jgi:mannose-6-phosphate isomerase-like protein (cupin superfamily)
MRYALFTVFAFAALAAEPSVLYSRLPSGGRSAPCSYSPMFGENAADASVSRGLVRYGVLTATAECKPAAYPGEEQIWFVLDGAGTVTGGAKSAEIAKDDFMYFAPGEAHGATRASRGPLHILVMGYRVAQGAAHAAPGQLPKANLRDVKLQVVGSHPPSTLYQLLIGTTESKRDKLAVAATVTSLFIMEFAPGGTNNPHKHKGEEEVYILLDGHGDMVAGNEKRPATAGDAYYFPPDTTVGFYNSNVAGEPKAYILGPLDSPEGVKPCKSAAENCCRRPPRRPSRHRRIRTRRRRSCASRTCARAPSPRTTTTPSSASTRTRASTASVKCATPASKASPSS